VNSKISIVAGSPTACVVEKLARGSQSTRRCEIKLIKPSYYEPKDICIKVVAVCLKALANSRMKVVMFSLL
jgi:hypothetical protein